MHIPFVKSQVLRVCQREFMCACGCSCVQLPPVQQPQGFVAGTSIILSRSQPCTPILIPHKPTPTQVTLQGVRHITHIPQRSPPASNAQPRSPAPRMATVPAAPTPTVPYSGAAASLLLGTRVTITNSQGSRSGKVRLKVLHHH